MTDPFPFLAAAHKAAQRDAEAANGRHWVDAEGDDDATAWVMNEDMHLFETDPATARHAANNSPQATLRRIAADRKQYAEHLPISDHGRFSNRYGEDCPDWCEGVCHDQPKVCRTCRDYAGDLIEAPCRTIEIMAEGYGWTETEQQ